MYDHPINPNIRLTDGSFYADDPHPHFQWMRELAPVYWDAAAQVWGVARYDDVLAIAKDPVTFCNRYGIRPDAPVMPYMIDMDDPDHRQRRTLVHKGFTPRQVREHGPRIRAVAIELIERAKERERFDFVMGLAAWLPLIVIGDLLGVEAAYHEDLLRWSESMVLGSGATNPELLEPASQAFNDYVAYQRGVISDRRGKPLQGDLVSVLTHAEIDGERLNDDELLMEALLILIGGDETTRHVMTGGVHQLLRHPEQRRRLAADPSLIPTAVEEMLRWVTPIQNMARTATRTVDLRGQRIEEGQKLLLLYPSANRDAAVFRDPFVFDSRRTPNEHIAFGFGTHFCLGASLARLELQIFFEELLQRMPQLALASETPPVYRASNFICGIETLPVTCAA